MGAERYKQWVWATLSREEHIFLWRERMVTVAVRWYRVKGGNFKVRIAVCLEVTGNEAEEVSLKIETKLRSWHCIYTSYFLEHFQTICKIIARLRSNCFTVFFIMSPCVEITKIYAKIKEFIKPQVMHSASDSSTSKLLSHCSDTLSQFLLFT